jgi:hypothetical protein
MAGGLPKTLPDSARVTNVEIDVRDRYQKLCSR